jgi:hypothetical protein
MRISKPSQWAISFLFIFTLMPKITLGATYCGHGLAAQVGQEYFDPEPLLEYLDKTPDKFVGALRIEDAHKPRTVIFVVGEPPADLTDGLSSVGNEPHRLLASRSLILPPDRVKTESFHRKLGWGLWGTGAATLGHELLNPGLIPNNLPIVPAVLGAFVLPSALGNLRALGRRLFSGLPQSRIALTHALADYVHNFEPPRPGFLRRLFRRGTSYPDYLHVVLVSPTAVGIGYTQQNGFMSELTMQLSALTSNATRLSSIDSVRSILQEQE